MRISQEELIKKYLPPFTDFDFSNKIIFGYRGADYDLTDKDGLTQLISVSVKVKDYNIGKIANNILAVYEMKSRTENYCHYPVIMHVELSEVCNCECIMCKHCYEKNVNAKYLSRQAFGQLKIYFPTCKLVIINGYGEPFIHPDISEIISAFAEYDIRILTTTNAQYIPADSLQKIDKSFMRINVSCDGATERTYQSIRRHASFEKFKANVRTLRENCPHVQLYLSVVAMRQNIHEAVELVRLAKEYGFGEIRFGRLGSNVFLGNERDELIFYPNYAGYMLNKAREEGEKLGVRVVLPLIVKEGRIDYGKIEKEREEIGKTDFFKDDAYYDGLAKEYVKKYNDNEFRPRPYSVDASISCKGMCHWIAFGMYINASGKVRPCAEIPFNREQEEREENIDFNYRELKDFRKVFISDRVPKVCMDCAFIMSDEVGTLKVDLEEYKKYFVDKAAKKE